MSVDVIYFAGMWCGVFMVGLGVLGFYAARGFADLVRLLRRPRVGITE